MDFMIRYKRYFLLLGMLVCVAGIIFSLQPGYKPTVFENALGYVVVPLQRGASRMAHWVGGKFAVLSDMNRLQAENDALKETISRLQLDNERLKLAEAENATLSALLAIAQQYAELPTVGARIISKDPYDWYDTYFIDKGTDHGLAKNMAVLGDGGLVGVISQAYANYAQVISIIDDRSSVTVVCPRTGDVGIVKGDSKLMPQGLCRMEYISGDAQLMVGDEVLTSSLSAIFPPGLLVGTVTEIKPDANGMTQYAIIKPAAHIEKLETVLVVNALFGSGNSIQDEPVFLD